MTVGAFQKRWGGILLALLAATVAGALRALLDPWLGDRPQYLIFLLAVLVAALLGGLLPGLIATVSSIAIENLATPRGMPGSIVDLLLFLAGAALVLLLATRAHAGQMVIASDAQQQAERQLRASLNQFRSILATVPDAMVVIDEHARILSFSAAAERLFGFTEAEMVGTNISRLMPTQDRGRHDDYVARYLATGDRRVIGRGRVVVIARRRDGSTFPMELSVGEALTDGVRVFTGFIRDLTEKQRAEARIEQLRADLVHAARLSAMGTMASTLAHELNQPITAVVNYVRGAGNLMRVAERSNLPIIQHALDEATAEAMRAGSIVRRLREFVARGDSEKSVEDLEALVEEASQLALIGARESGVETRFLIDRASAEVLVDKIQTQQVLINLMRNAVDAMAESAVRRLTVSSQPETGGYVRVTVTDTGPGIDPEIAENLFRAFNSSKKGGMGLGLSICRTIVEANGGKIWSEARPEGGTAFHFTLVRMETEQSE
ncbi:sensor histidine kinase [Sphingomonas kyeonggiensis]|uniref:Sensor protein FixL n=1 Tax=Sphingomonas kyeonggiensis TaxID=1268553 RepID=A0A7W6NU01_9SPHN|nr:PAS domain-containing sensor histidine kinase [Sphingomonas kyeonggiensis]MBB4096484.1 two-component system sensor kinase FixL [Sphingomonas kyeonggiensis]